MSSFTCVLAWNWDQYFHWTTHIRFSRRKNRRKIVDKKQLLSNIYDLFLYVTMKGVTWILNDIVSYQLPGISYIRNNTKVTGKTSRIGSNTKRKLRGSTQDFSTVAYPVYIMIQLLVKCNHFHATIIPHETNRFCLFFLNEEYKTTEHVKYCRKLHIHLATSIFS